jgi:hypothetical protein
MHRWRSGQQMAYDDGVRRQQERSHAFSGWPSRDTVRRAALRCAGRARPRPARRRPLRRAGKKPGPADGSVARRPPSKSCPGWGDLSPAPASKAATRRSPTPKHASTATC